MDETSLNGYRPKPKRYEWDLQPELDENGAIRRYSDGGPVNVTRIDGGHLRDVKSVALYLV